jgi:Putative transposase/Transposase zinc-binding domain
MAGPCSAVAHVGYERRRPERTVLHQLVSQHVQTLWAEAEAASAHGFGYPSWVKREFERYLTCGLLPGGFTRLRCRGCGCERLVGFSCKGRLCPSCVSRRMADLALHLVDHVLPSAPYRQWTLTFPYPLRLRLCREPALLSAVLSDFLRGVFRWQRLQARRAGVKVPLAGAVTCVQLWGSLLQLTPHFHAWLPDGVFSQQADGALRFHRLAPPTDADVERLLQRVAARVMARFAADEDVEPDLPDDDLAVAAAQAESLHLPTGALAPVETEPIRRRPRCAARDGFTLHADLAIVADDRAARQRALRYGLRPPLSHKRLSLTPAGNVRLTLRKPLPSGRSDLIFEPVTFLRRLAASLPRPRQNMLRFHGIFAPRAAARSRLAALLPKPPAPPAPLPSLRVKLAEAQDAAAGVPLAGTRAPVPLPYRRPWAELLKRIHDHDVLRCPRCDQRLR